MSLDAQTQELREVFGGLLRHASTDMRMKLLDLAELVKSVHRNILQTEHDCQQAKLTPQAAEAVNRLLVCHFGNPGLTADDQAADLQHALGFSRSRLEEAMKEAYKVGHAAAHHS